MPRKLKDNAKENPVNREDDKNKVSKIHKKKLFAYSFAIMDLDTRMYIAFGSSMRSERGAYDRAMNLLSSTGIEMDSIRLDRYCTVFLNSEQIAKRIMRRFPTLHLLSFLSYSFPSLISLPSLFWIS